ncbi:MAG TPA: ImmA/IrrE family metallo-endopeptidase [Chloroflexia bacterium]|nr:ImmA/IrrE family metallo-endopeptidase [Chloroflexia bacterium]
MYNLTGFVNREESAPIKYDQAFKAAKTLIAYFNLHQNPDEMVDIGQLFETYDLRFLELPEAIWGFTLQLDDTATTIAINQKLTSEQTRYVAVHEIGHIACAHPNQFHNCLQEQVLSSQEEFEANIVAAYLLIPHLALATTLLGGTSSLSEVEIEELSRHYLVPHELVILRQELFQLTAY